MVSSVTRCTVPFTFFLRLLIYMRWILLIYMRKDMDLAVHHSTRAQLVFHVYTQFVEFSHQESSLSTSSLKQYNYFIVSQVGSQPPTWHFVKCLGKMHNYAIPVMRPKCRSCHGATMVIAVRAHYNPLGNYVMMVFFLLCY